MFEWADRKVKMHFAPNIGDKKSESTVLPETFWVPQRNSNPTYEKKRDYCSSSHHGFETIRHKWWPISTQKHQQIQRLLQ